MYSAFALGAERNIQPPCPPKEGFDTKYKGKIQNSK